MFEPKGAIVRRMRLTVAGETDDGTRYRTIIPGIGVIAHVRADARSRRTFARLAARLGIITTDVTAREGVDGAITSGSYVERDGTFNRRTGARERAEQVAAVAFSCVSNESNVGAIRELVSHPCVERWAFAMAVRVPHAGQGAGEEKPRPASGTMFGKPATVAATGRQLAADHAQRVAAAGL